MKGAIGKISLKVLKEGEGRAARPRVADALRQFDARAHGPVTKVTIRLHVLVRFLVSVLFAAFFHN